MATATLKAKLTLNDSLFQAGIKRAAVAVADFGKTVAKVGFTTLKVGVLGATTAMVAGSRSITNLGDDLLRMKRATGISVESLFVLREAFEQAGTSAEAMVPGIGKMQKNLFASSKGGGLRATIENLGIDFRKLIAMRPDEQFLVLGKAIDKLPDLKKQAVAMQIFGKAGLNMLPVFAELKDFDSKGLEKQAKFMDKNAEAFDNANDSIRRMKTLFGGLFGGMAVMMGPLLEKLAKAFSGVDWLSAGERISRAVSNIVKTGIGLLSHPELIWDAFVDAAKFAITRIGPLLMEGLMRAVVWFGKAFGSVIGKTIVIAGEMLVAIAIGMGGALIDAFMNAVAYLHAGLAYSAINFVATITKGLQQVLGALGISIGATKGTTWKDQIKKSKDTFVTGGAGAKMMAEGSRQMAVAMNDLKTMFKGGGIAKARKAGEDEWGIRSEDSVPEKDRNKYGKGNWRKRTMMNNTVIGASMAHGLTSDPRSTLMGGSLIASAAAPPGGILPEDWAKMNSKQRNTFMDAAVARGDMERPNGMIRAGDKKRRDAYEKIKIMERIGVDKTNDILTQINNKIGEIE